MSNPVFHINEEDAYLYTIDNYLAPKYADYLFVEGDKLPLIHRPKMLSGFAKRDVSFYSKTVPYYKFAGQKTRTQGSPEFIENLITIVNKSFENVLSGMGFKLNAILVNRYNSGEDIIGSHSDSEKQLKQELIIAMSVFKDITGTRKFRIRRVDGGKINDANFLDIITKHGQLLVMGGKFQEIFKHEIPAEKLNKKAYRISYTIRSHSENEKDYD